MHYPLYNVSRIKYIFFKLNLGSREVRKVSRCLSLRKTMIHLAFLDIEVK